MEKNKKFNLNGYSYSSAGTQIQNSWVPDEVLRMPTEFPFIVKVGNNYFKVIDKLNSTDEYYAANVINYVARYSAFNNTRYLAFNYKGDKFVISPYEISEVLEGDIKTLEQLYL